MSKRLILYSADGCPWAHRTRIALKASGAPFELVEIDLRNKPDWYPRINPLTKVPAISYGAPENSDPSDPPAGTFVYTESALIVDFIASLFPSIDYKDPIPRAKANFALDQYDQLVAPHWGKLQRAGDIASLEPALSGLNKWQDYLVDEILGEEYGVADAKLAPFITRLFIYSDNDVGAWPEGTGSKIKKTLQGPEYEKLRQFAQKLRGWSAFEGTIDEANMVEKALVQFQKVREEKQGNGHA